MVESVDSGEISGIYPFFAMVSEVLGTARLHWMERWGRFLNMFKYVCG